MGDREIRDKQEKLAHHFLQMSSFEKYIKQISKFNWTDFLFKLNYVVFSLLLFCHKDGWIYD